MKTIVGTIVACSRRSDTREHLIRGRGRLWIRDLTWSFFASSWNIEFPESFILPFFTRKVSFVIFSEGDYALSRSQNDKTFNIWYLVFATTTFVWKPVVEWCQLPRFPAKMTLAHARTLLSIEKISVLVVVLVLESKGLYYSACKKWREKKKKGGDPNLPSSFLRLLFDSLATIWTPRFTIQTPGRG